jgi:hypothetical protein
MSVMFFIWSYFSLDLLLKILLWPSSSPDAGLYSFLFFTNSISFVSWFVFAITFIIFAYGTYHAKKWVWTTGLIISSLYLAIFALMTGSFMVTAILYMDYFSVVGLITVVISLLLDLGIIYCLTRLKIKNIFNT